MDTMRRVLLSWLLLFSFSLLFSGADVTAHASSAEYFLIARDDISLYADSIVPSPLFTLQKTFYVKLITRSITPDYHVVEYNGVRGIVKSSEVGNETVSDVKNPYYTAQTITPHINTRLFSAPSFSAQTEVEASGLSLTYLGKVSGDRGSYDTAVWFAVLYANEPYYIHCSLTNNLGLLESTFAPVHPNSVKETAVSAGEDGESAERAAAEESSFDAVRLLLIIGMIVPAVVILFLLFKPKKHRRKVAPKRARRYPDDEDYDDYYD